MPNLNKPRVEMNVPEYIAVGVKTDFSVTFYPGDMEGTMVQGAATFPAGSYTAWYYESSNGEWYEFQGSSESTESIFGGASGFPLKEATSYFRVQFNEEMTGNFVVRIKEVDTGDYLAQNEAEVRAIRGETIDELNARIALAKPGDVIRLSTDVVGSMSIANTVAIDGQGYRLHGNVVLSAKGTEPLYDVSLSNLIIDDTDGDATLSKGFGIIGQNQTADTPVRPVNLVVRDCAIGHCSVKGMYLTNTKSLNVVGCTIGYASVKAEESAKTYPDYAIDVNLCGVQNAAIRIVDSTFTAMCASVGAVKIAQRGGVGLTDDVNDDIFNTVSGSIASCVVAGNDFSAVNGGLGTVLSDAVAYRYSGYTYTGAISAAGSTISAMYDSTMSELINDFEAVVNDFDRMMGALYYASGVQAVSWNGTAYIWSGSREASNWVDASGANFVSTVTSWVLSNIQSMTSPTIAFAITTADGEEHRMTYAIGLGSTAASAVANVFIGASANSDGTMRSYCASYPASITARANGETLVTLRGATGEDVTFTLPAGGTCDSYGEARGDKTFTVNVTTSEGVTAMGSVGGNVVLASHFGWEYPDGGVVGLGFNGLRRLIMRGTNVEYPTNGFEVPEGFHLVAVLEASADGGVMSWYDRSTDTIRLYSARGTEVSGTLKEVVLVLVGTL